MFGVFQQTIFSPKAQQQMETYLRSEQTESFPQGGEGGHGGRVVTLSPPTSEAGVQSPSRPYVGKLVVACRWSAVYSTEP